MGLFDFLKTEEQKRDEVAREIACRTGVLERCPVCRALFDRGHDERLPAADALAHELFERNDPLVAVFQGVRIPLKMTADSEERDRLAHRFLTGAGFLLRAVTIGQLGGQFAHRFPAQFEAVRTVQQSVEDGVRQGRLADVVVPVLGG